MVVLVILSILIMAFICKVLIDRYDEIGLVVLLVAIVVAVIGYAVYDSSQIETRTKTVDRSKIEYVKTEMVGKYGIKEYIMYVKGEGELEINEDFYNELVESKKVVVK